MKTYLLLPLLASCALSDPELEALDDDSQPEAQTSEQASELGADTCRDTDITITNSFEHEGRGKAIRVHRIEFFSPSEGWNTEDLNNTGMDYGATLTWFNEDLAKVKNDTITHFRVYFQYVEYIPDPELIWWSGLHYMELNTPDKVCVEDAKFSMTVD